MTAPVLQLTRPAGRGRQPAEIERLRDLEDEVSALTAERTRNADEIEALARRMELAFHADRPDIALHVAGRLEALAHSMARRGAA